MARFWFVTVWYPNCENHYENFLKNILWKDFCDKILNLTVFFRYLNLHLCKKFLLKPLSGTFISGYSLFCKIFCWYFFNSDIIATTITFSQKLIKEKRHGKADTTGSLLSENWTNYNNSSFRVDILYCHPWLNFTYILLSFVSRWKLMTKYYFQTILIFFMVLGKKRFPQQDCVIS